MIRTDVTTCNNVEKGIDYYLNGEHDLASGLRVRFYKTVDAKEYFNQRGLAYLFKDEKGTLHVVHKNSWVFNTDPLG